VNAVETQEVRAVAKWVHMSPRKARLVAEHIRGRSVPEARTVLAFTQRAAAREVEKVLRSAVANAEANHGLIGDNLVVAAAYVDEGPVMKRWRARARGRVARIKKPTCHITVKLVPGVEAPSPAPTPPAALPAEEKTGPTSEPESAEAKPKAQTGAGAKSKTSTGEKRRAPRTRKEAPEESQTSSDS
jgi:large subunit ribosomal protein L22